MKKILKNNYVLVFLISILIGSIYIIPNIITNNGLLILNGDFNNQQVLFGTYMNKAIKSGNYIYNFSNNLGLGFIESFGYYNLGSPFFLITLLFKAEWFKYLIGPLTLFKLGLCSITSYMYLKRYFKNPKYAIMGCILYTFSGFQLNSMIYQFIDQIVLFPLLLYSFDNLIYDKKKKLFLIMVFLSASTNFFLFTEEVVFIVIYYFIKMFSKEIKFNIKIFGSILLESILGLLCSSIIFFPSILGCLSNSKIIHEHDFSSLLSYSLPEYLNYFKCLFYVSDNMFTNSLLYSNNYVSKECYLPFISSILFFNYIFNKRKSWISILSFILLVMAFFPFLNSIFLLGSSTKYFRWYYILTLVMILASMKSIEEIKDIKRGVLTYIGIILYFVINSLIGKSSGTLDAVITNLNIFIVNVIILTLSFVSLIFIYKSKNKYNYIFIGIILMSIFTWSFDTYNKNKFFKKEGYNTKFVSRLNNTNLESFGLKSGLDNRMDTFSFKYINYNLLYNKSSSSFYSSSTNENYIRLNRSLDVIAGNGTYNYTSSNTYYYNCFMNTKYVLNDKEITDRYKFLNGNDIVKLYETDNNVNFGVVINNYMSISEYKKLNIEDRYKVLNNNVILNNKDINKYKDRLYGPNIAEDYDEVLNNVNDEGKVTFTKDSIIKEVDAKSDGILVMQFINDKHFNVTVNGKKKDLLDVDNGLMGVYVNKGKNIVRFNYDYSYYKMYLCISITSIILSGIYFILDSRKRE